MNNEFEREVLDRLTVLEQRLDSVIEQLKRMNGKVRKNQDNITKLTTCMVVIAVILILAIPAIRAVLPII